VSQIVIDTGYRPRPLQAVVHRSLKRFNVLVFHRRFGKTHLALNEIIDQALRNDKYNPQYAYIAPTYGQAKRVAWDVAKQYTKDIPGVSYNESDLRLEIDRPAKKDKIKILLLGAENPDALRGLYLDGVVFDEFASMDPTVWTTVVRAALSDRLGWAIFISTPKGRNHFWDVFYFATKGDPERGVPVPDDWFAKVYKASETNIIPKSELDAARALMSEEEYEQEFECSFSAALVGAYYGKEMERAEKEGRVGNVPYDEALLVDTFWDLGIDDTTAIWFGQRLRDHEYRWIDYIEESGQGLEYYIKEIQKRPYVYGTHYLPHDAAARELGTGKTREEVLRAKGLGRKTQVVRRTSIADGIQAVRMILAKSWFDAVKCAKGVESLKSYERKWDAKNKIYQQTPLHNWASHGADAFRTGATAGTRDESRERDDERSLPRFSQRKFRIV